MQESSIATLAIPLSRPGGKAPAPDARPLPFWTLILLAIVALAVYGNSLKNGFTLDDVAIVQINEHVNNLDWTQIWSDNYWPKQDGVAPDILYRPLTIWSYLATRAVSPEGAWAFHLGNILLHALVTVMASVLAQRIFANRPIAWITGLLFALHPLHTEVVANIVGRAELLSAVFSLAALLVYLPTRPLLLETVPPKRSFWHGILVGLCFFLALLCKETPVALLAAFGFIDIWRYSRSNNFGISFPRWMLRQGVRYYLPLLAFFGIYLAMRVHACGMLRDPNGTSMLVNPLVAATFVERLVTPFALFAKYLNLTFWPGALSADYSFPSLMPTAKILAPLPLLGFLTTLLAGLASIKLWRKAPHIVLTIALFAFSYALVANFMAIGTIMSERLFYLPSLFVLMLVAAAGVAGYRGLLAMSPENEQHPLVVRCLALGILGTVSIAMTIRTYVRNTDWEDNIHLAIATARDNPQSAKACFWAGNILAGPTAPPQFRKFGKELLHRSIELYPTYGEAYFELAKDHRLDQDLPESVINLAQAAQYGPGKSDIRAGLDAIVPDLKLRKPDEYMPALLKNQADHPDAAAAKLAVALAYFAQEKYPEAQAACTEALRLDGHFHEAACELAVISLASGNRQQAIEMLLQYVSHVRGNAGVRFTLASTFLSLDPVKNPGAYARAEFFISQGEKLDKYDTRARTLRAQLAQKRAAMAAQAPSSTVDAHILAATGGQR